MSIGDKTGYYHKGYGNLGVLVLLISIGLIVGLAGGTLGIYYNLQEDIDGYKERADSATTAGQMAYYLELTVEGIENKGLDTVNWSLIADSNRDTDMAHTCKQYSELIERLKTIEENENISSMDYATSLEEIKRNFPKIGFNSYASYVKATGKWFLQWEFFSILLYGVLAPFGLLVIPLWLQSRPIIPASLVCKLKGHRWKEEKHWDSVLKKDVVGYECIRCDAEKRKVKK